jgi:hypothetical protein
MAKKEIKQVVDFPFGRENYIWMLAGIGLVFLGFVFMVGGGSEDPAVWNPAIYSPMRITVAPILVIAGFVVEVFAIIKKAKD